MTLKNGIYEVKDLFYEDAGYMLAVTDGNLDFEKGAGQDSRLKLEIRRPEVNFGKTVVVPGFSKERGEFAKSLVKTLFVRPESERDLSENIRKLMVAYARACAFEKSFVLMTALTATCQSGRRFRLGPMTAKIMETCPTWKKEFRPWLHNRILNGRPEDKKLYDDYVKNNKSNVPEYLWTGEDQAEFEKILEANPFFRKYLAGNAV